MATNIVKTKRAIESFINSLNQLRDVGILTNKKDFTSQVGEWLVETLFDGKRARSGKQKGWDVKVKRKLIQVKTHSKSKDGNRWTKLEGDDSDGIHELIIIVFTKDYKLLKFYQVPYSKALSRRKLRGIKKQSNDLNWSSIKEYEKDLQKLPKQEIIKLFT